MPKEFRTWSNWPTSYNSGRYASGDEQAENETPKETEETPTESEGQVDTRRPRRFRSGTIGGRGIAGYTVVEDEDTEEGPVPDQQEPVLAT